MRFVEPGFVTDPVSSSKREKLEQKADRKELD